MPTYPMRQPVTTNPYVTDPLNKIQAVVGNVSPKWETRHMLQHGRYLSGMDGLTGCPQVTQKTRDGQFQVGTQPDFMVEGDEPDWSDALMGENEHEDDSVGSGIFDPTGGATVHTDMGVFADHPAVPGYIARNPPFYVNPEVTDITADAQVLEVPGGGLNYVEKGGVNVAPPISPWARFEPYVTYPCQSQFHPRQPDRWGAPGSREARPPLPMTPRHLWSPGSPQPTEPYTPSPPATGIPTIFGHQPWNQPWHKPSGGSGGGGAPGGPPPVSTVPGPGGPSTQGSFPGKPPPGTTQGTRPPPPPHNALPGLLPQATQGFGDCNQGGGMPYKVREVPMRPRQARVRSRPATSLVPFQRTVEPIDMATMVTPCGGNAMGLYGYGQDPGTAPAPAPTPDPSAAPTTPGASAGVGTYVMAGVVVGVAAYLFYGAVSGKAK